MEPPTNSISRSPYLTVASLDVGAVHFAVYVERVPRGEWEAWIRNRDRGHPRPRPPRGQCVWKVVWDLTSPVLGAVADPEAPYLAGFGYDLTHPEPTQDTDPRVPSLSLTQIPWAHKHLLWNLERHHYLWSGADQILVERQLNRNPRAVRLETVCLTYFHTRCPHVRAASYPAKFKTVLLGYRGPRGARGKGARKVWAVARALDLCRLRGDARLAAWFQTPRRKKDDLADAMLMVQAWKLQQAGWGWDGDEDEGEGEEGDG